LLGSLGLRNARDSDSGDDIFFKKKVDLRTDLPMFGGRGSTIVRSAVAPCEEAASLLRISNSSCFCGDLGGRRGAVKGIGRDIACSPTGSWEIGLLRYGRSDDVGNCGMSSGCIEPPVTVLERVLVLGRRARLTPLAILELLATERIEPGL